MNPTPNNLYIETSIPAGITIDQYRRSRRRASRWERLKQLAGGAQAATA
jgi:hypothetical protein